MDIRVESLFYNTPARLKYIKSLYTELGKITDIINRMAMSHPDIRISLGSTRTICMNNRLTISY